MAEKVERGEITSLVQIHSSAPVQATENVSKWVWVCGWVGVRKMKPPNMSISSLQSVYYVNSVCPSSHLSLTSEVEVFGGWSTVSSEVRHVCPVVCVRPSVSVYGGESTDERKEMKSEGCKGRSVLAGQTEHDIWVKTFKQGHERR